MMSDKDVQAKRYDAIGRCYWLCPVCGEFRLRSEFLRRVCHADGSWEYEDARPLRCAHCRAIRATVKRPLGIL